MIQTSWQATSKSLTSERSKNIRRSVKYARSTKIDQLSHVLRKSNLA